MNNIKIRKKYREDCNTIAHVVTTVWNKTYRVIINDEFLDNLSGYENLELLAKINNLINKEDIEETLKIVDFYEKKIKNIINIINIH